MNTAQQLKFDALHQQHINVLRRQDKAASTIDVYGRAVRRITAFYDRCPDRLTQEHLKEYFSALVQSHSWITCTQCQCVMSIVRFINRDRHHRITPYGGSRTPMP